MSPEIDSINKKKWLEQKMSATVAHWNSQGEWISGPIDLRTTPDVKGRSREYHISGREFEVMQLIIEGIMHNKDLAEFMGIDQSTIKNYIAEILSKFGVAAGKGGKGLLLYTLVDSGILTFMPRIPEENWLGLRHENEPHDHASGA